MGSLIVEQIVSADGFAVDADGGMSFMAGSDPAAVDTDQLELMGRVEAIVLGRRTYELFAGFWPDASEEHDPVAGPINALPKHVVSSTLSSAPWGEHPPAVVESGDAVAAVDQIVAETAGDVIVWGSLTLTDALFRAGRVHVLRLRLVPTLIGSGRTATPPDLPLTLLELTGSRVHPTGQVTLEYRVER